MKRLPQMQDQVCLPVLQYMWSLGSGVFACSISGFKFMNGSSGFKGIYVIT